MSIYTIYKATNTINGKVYIGFAKDVHSRIASHRRHYKNEDTKFYRAIRKYGWDSFSWDVVYQSQDGDHTLNKMEPYFIELFESYTTGYNSTLGGDGCLGAKRSKETRSKISKTLSQTTPLRGVPKTEEHKEKLRLANTGSKTISDSQKNKPKLTCPHCGLTGGYYPMKRWHFENCRKL